MGARMAKTQRPNKMKKESTSLLNMLDSLYAEGLPRVTNEAQAVEGMTPQQDSMTQPPMDQMPAMTEEEMKKKKRKPTPFDNLLDESVTPPGQIIGGY